MQDKSNESESLMGIDRGSEVVNTRTHKMGIVKDWSDLQPAGMAPLSFAFSVLVEGQLEIWPANETAPWQGKDSIASTISPISKKESGIVFISCGQSTPGERALGAKIFELIKNKTPYQPYYADQQTSLRGLTDNIFNQLNKCVGLIVVLQKRDPIGDPKEGVYRGSLFIEQEIAIASFIEQILERRLGVFLYKEIGVKLEGIRTYLHLNSTIDFSIEEEIIRDLKQKIEKGELKFDATPTEAIISDVQFINEFLKSKVLRIELLMSSQNLDFKHVYEIFQSLKDAIHITFGENERNKYLSSPGIEPKYEPPSPWVSLTRMREFLIGSLIDQFNAKKLDISFKRTELPQYEDSPIVVRVIAPQKEFYLIKGRTKRRVFGVELMNLGIQREDDPNTPTVSAQELSKYRDI